MTGRFVYSTDLFDRATIQRFLGDFQALLEELVAEAGVPVHTASAAFSPADPIERQLIAIWEELLDQRPIGVNQNFFALGGHSMLLAKLILQVEQTFHKTLSMATVFRGQPLHNWPIFCAKRTLHPKPAGCSRFSWKERVRHSFVWVLDRFSFHWLRISEAISPH